jgi:Flp pilus assembly protein protease CpaA
VSAAVISLEGFIALSDREAAAAAKKAAWEAERTARRTAIEAGIAADPGLVAKYASRRRTQEAWCEAAEAVAGKIAA